MAAKKLQPTTNPQNLISSVIQEIDDVNIASAYIRTIGTRIVHNKVISI
jgi:hypothetical protein